MEKQAHLSIRKAQENDTPLILKLIQDLAKFEKLSHEVITTEDILRDSLFKNSTGAEVIIGEYQNRPVAFALFFHNFSTFLGRPGIYLEDLFVKPEVRSKGFGKVILKYIANLAQERDCGRFEWSVLDWNKRAISFYEKLGANPMQDWTTYRLSGKALDDLASS